METFHKTKLCIIGSGPAAHTAAIYAARADLTPILFEGWKANDIPPGGQLTTTTDVENFPGFPQGILGVDLVKKLRKQSERFGAKIFTETVNKVDLSSKPFKLFTNLRTVLADAVIISTGAIAKRLTFAGSGEGPGGFWNRGISACAVCDGEGSIFRDKPLVVIGGGDSAMEEAIFLTKYGSKVYIIHRRDKFRASKIMQRRVFSNPKIEVIGNGSVVEAYGDENGMGVLGGLKVKNVVTGDVSDLKASGLFFAVGSEPATKFLEGQVELDEDGYVVTKGGSTETSMAGVFAAGEVGDKKYRQAITAAGTGCMAALDAVHYLQEIGSQQVKLGQAVRAAPPTVELGQAVRAAPLTVELGQAVRAAPLTVELGQAVRAAPLTVEPGQAVRAAPLTVEFGQAVRGAPLTVELGQAVRAAPPTVEFGQSVIAAPPTVEFGQAVRAAPPTVGFGQAVRAAPLTVEFGQVLRADPLAVSNGVSNTRRERYKWSPNEDDVLISAWLNTNKDKDPYVGNQQMGNEQRASSFWKRIAAYYSSSPAAASLPKREWNHCKQRWQKINDGVSKFVECYDHALSQRTRGQSEDDVVQVAYHFYFNNYKIKFTFENAWRQLRHEKKWRMSQSSKTSGSSKRRKFDEGDTVTLSSSSNTKSNVEEHATVTPISVKSSEHTEKKVVTETTNEERESSSRSRLENLWALNERDIAERNKLSRIELLRSLLGKTEKLSEKEETLKNKLIDEML